MPDIIIETPISFVFRTKWAESVEQVFEGTDSIKYNHPFPDTYKL